MKTYRSQATYVRRPEDYETFRGVSMTVPDQTLTVRQILTRFATGTIPNIEDDENYTDDLPDVRNYDFSDYANHSASLDSEIDRIQRDLSVGHKPSSSDVDSVVSSDFVVSPIDVIDSTSK